MLLKDLQIFAWLIDAVDKTASTEEKARALEGDALLAIVAGRYVFNNNFLVRPKPSPVSSFVTSC